MINVGKCPKCQKSPSYLKYERMFGHEGATKWKITNFICPSCNTIISSSVDHPVFHDVLLDRIKKLFGR